MYCISFSAELCKSSSYTIIIVIKIVNCSESTEAVKEEEEGPKEMTLDEWKAMQAKNKASVSFNVRKAGEGVDDAQWKKTYELKKKVVEEAHDDSDEEEDDVCIVYIIK